MYWAGVTPNTALNLRCTWCGLSPTCSASTSRVIRSSLGAAKCASMYCRARSIEESREPAGESGLHRWHALKPARSAASADEKKRTLSRLGLREGHEGRQ